MYPQSVNNVKASCKLKSSSGQISSLLRSLARKSKKVKLVRPNFFVLRSKWVYVVFFKGHLNLTKLASTHHLGAAMDHFARLFVANTRRSIVITRPRIDNITSSGSLQSNRGVSLFSLCNYLRRSGIKYRYNPHKFPGLNLRIGGSTFVLFNSGKFVLVGTKSISQIKSATRCLKNVVDGHRHSFQREY